MENDLTAEPGRYIPGIGGFMAIDQHTVINLKLRSNTAKICANCEHWHPDAWAKWGWCDVALNHGTFHNHRTGCLTCRHSNNRYRSQKGCKNRFQWRADHAEEEKRKL